MQFTQVSELDLQLEVPLLVPDTVGSFSRLPNFTDPIAERLVAMLPDTPRWRGRRRGDGDGRVRGCVWLGRKCGTGCRVT